MHVFRNCQSCALCISNVCRLRGICAYVLLEVLCVTLGRHNGSRSPHTRIPSSRADIEGGVLSRRSLGPDRQAGNDQMLALVRTRLASDCARIVPAAQDHTLQVSELLQTHMNSSFLLEAIFHIVIKAHMNATRTPRLSRGDVMLFIPRLTTASPAMDSRVAVVPLWLGDVVRAGLVAGTVADEAVAATWGSIKTSSTI